MGWYDWNYYTPTTPIAVKGGIKSQVKRGEVSSTWWGKLWIEALLRIAEDDNRLTRGRSYARRGQVVSIDVQKGIIKAKVQGSRPKPYDVKIEIPAIPDEKWRKLAKFLSKQIYFAAKLVSGEMPKDIE
jgi:uncharacterized Zn finger protein